MNFFSPIHHLPLRWIGLKNLPAYPIEIRTWADTLFKLLGRQKETLQAKRGLSHTYTIQGHTSTGYEFCFSAQTEKQKDAKMHELLKGVVDHPAGAVSMLHAQVLKPSDEPSKELAGEALNGLFLDDPTQFGLSLTTFDDIYREAEPHLKEWASVLDDVPEATRQFWPMIAGHGLVYNLLILRKLNSAEALRCKATFQSIWTDSLEAARGSGTLYLIDLTLFENLEHARVQGADRFTPATYTLLIQDPVTKALTPAAISVSGHGGARKQYYNPETSSRGAWIYALTAARTSVTVYGIMLGHIYHWHLIPAAMFMTFQNHLPADHPLYPLLDRQSHYLIGFNNTLLLLWSTIAPPTSVHGVRSFLELENQYALGRTFFEDDPKDTLRSLGIREEDFTTNEPWDQYPIVKTMLTVWDATERYVSTYVKTQYPDEASIARDEKLRAWITASGDPEEGNVAGLPEVKDWDSLIHVLTSILYRVTMHGASRLRTSDTPAFTFVSNFPPCLQSIDIPDPQKPLDTQELLARMPKTGTIGEMISFIYIFVFSSPYKPFIPLGGIDTELFSPPVMTNPCNQALKEFREVIAEVIGMRYGTRAPQLFQWPLNIET